MIRIAKREHSKLEQMSQLQEVSPQHILQIKPLELDTIKIDCLAANQQVNLIEIKCRIL